MPPRPTCSARMPKMWPSEPIGRSGVPFWGGCNIEPTEGVYSRVPPSRRVEAKRKATIWGGAGAGDMVTWMTWRVERQLRPN